MAFQGTVVREGCGFNPNVFRDIDTVLVDWNVDSQKVGKMHQGFLGLWQALKPWVLEFLPKATNYLMTGHSLGAAVATIAASELKYLHQNSTFHLVTFGQPNMCDKSAQDFIRASVLINKRYINQGQSQLSDLITKLPVAFLPGATESLLNHVDAKLPTHSPRDCGLMCQIDAFLISFTDCVGEMTASLGPILFGLVGALTVIADGLYNGKPDMLTTGVSLHSMSEYEKQAQLAGGFTCPLGQIANSDYPSKQPLQSPGNRISCCVWITIIILLTF